MCSDWLQFVLYCPSYDFLLFFLIIMMMIIISCSNYCKSVSAVVLSCNCYLLSCNK